MSRLMVKSLNEKIDEALTYYMRNDMFEQLSQLSITQENYEKALVEVEDAHISLFSVKEAEEDIRAEYREQLFATQDAAGLICARLWKLVNSFDKMAKFESDLCELRAA